MKTTFPRYILAELNTHRALSKNSTSSRAIPFEKLLKSVEENPFIPIAWMKDHKGMQGSEYINNPMAIETRNAQWMQARDYAISQAKLMSQDIRVFTSKTAHLVDELDAKVEDGEGVTKQFINRLLEPFMWHTVIITATDWENFFALRCPQYQYNELTFRSRKDWLQHNYHHKGVKKYVIPTSEIEWLNINKGMADIHMMALAEAIWDAYNESVPKKLKEGEWHIPYGDDISNDEVGDWLEKNGISVVKNEIQLTKVKIATARCARISYTVVGEESKPNFDQFSRDIALCKKLSESGHWSPFEHCAKAMDGETDEQNWRCGNFQGFIQYRKFFANENITKR